MDNPPQPESPLEKPKRANAIKVFAIGDAGACVIERMMDGGPPASSFVAINADDGRWSHCSAGEKVLLQTPLLRGLGSGGDPERGRAFAEEHAENLKSLCQNQDVVFVVSGLGGGTGSGISPVVTRLAKEAGAFVLVFVTLP